MFGLLGALFGVFGVLFGVLVIGILVGVLCVLFGALGVLFGVFGVLFGVHYIFGVYYICIFWQSWCLWHWDVVSFTFRIWDGAFNIFNKKMCRFVFYSLNKLS